MKKEIEINRYNHDLNGLTEEQVLLRKKQKLINKSKIVVGKSYFEIILSNVFNFFNILLFIIAALMIFGGIKSCFDLFFLIILSANIMIGLYQDIKARVLMDRLRISTDSKTIVIRNGIKQKIPTEELVLDDIVIFNNNCQIGSDSIVLKGSVGVNESLLTGESDVVYKKEGDVLLSGSFLINGECTAYVERVGKDNFVEKLQKQAKKFKRSPSQILRSLKRLFFGIGIIVITITIASLIVYATQNKLSSVEAFKSIIRPLAGSLVGMIPTGLYLLTSTALAVGVIVLAKKRARVQDFYSIEMLSRTDVLCVDKTGTITDGTMEVKKVILLSSYTETELSQIISNVIKATKDDNFTSRALNERFTYEMSAVLVKTLPFCSENKYSAASFKGGKTYIIGAPEFINLENKASILRRCSEFTCLGYRVLVVSESDGEITDKTYTNVSKAIGIIVLQDHIREKAIETFRWFKENNVNIKIISGDNAETVSEIARQADIDHFDRYISLENMSLEEVYKLAPNFTVFGRVTPEQKEVIIKSLKENGHTVAMTGDGVNDILALKRADCSIAMASGAEAARNVSHIVLLDSNFDTLPSVVDEGRRVVNNLQRTCSLFLVKTIFAMVMSIVFLFISCIDETIKYPYVTSNLLVWEVFTIGLSAFFLALERNSEQIKGKFLSNIFKKAVPAAIIILLSQLIVFLLYALNKKGIFYSNIETMECASAMGMLCFSILGISILFEVCYPFSKYRRIVFITSAVLTLLTLIVFGLIETGSNGSISPLQISFSSLNAVNYFTVIIIVILLTALYFTYNYLVRTLKGNKNNDQNQ